MKIPLADETVPQDNKKFEWKSWDCVDKLFKGVSITHTESSTTTSQTPSYTNLQNTSGDSQVSNHQKKMYLTTPVNFSNKLLACALFDYRGGSDVSTNKIYFKSEVAVQDENHGWIMWSGLSNTPSNTPSNKSETVTLEYRLLTLKKNNGNWEIDKGFGWSSPTNSNISDSSQYKLEIKLPAGNWTTANIEVGNGYSTRKIWSGIAKVDSASNQHLVESLDIHQKSTSDEAKKYGFWGRKEGKWLASEDGYDKANKMYVKDQGWQTLSQTIDLGDTLTE